MKYTFDPFIDHLSFNIVVEAELPLQSWGNPNVAGLGLQITISFNAGIPTQQ